MENEIDWKAAALAAATPSSGGGRCGGPRRARGAYTRGLRLNKARGRYCYSTTCAHLEAQLADVRSLQHQLLAEADSLRLKEQVCGAGQPQHDRRWQMRMSAAHACATP